MPRARTPYKLLDGTEVPGVTTILNRFKDSGGLIYWAWKQGKEGKDFREERDAAASAGTLAHALVEAHLKGEDLVLIWAPAPKEVYERGWQGYQNWLTWQQQSRFEITPWEKPLICEHYRYGGTPDALLTLDGKTVVGDWKTSAGGGAYVEHLLQLAAYRHLFKDAGHELAVGNHLCTFSRDNGDFVHRYFDDLSDALVMFIILSRAYELDKVLSKRVK